MSIRELSSSESPNDSTRRTGSADSVVNGEAAAVPVGAECMDAVEAGMGRARSVQDLKPGLGLDWKTMDAVGEEAVGLLAVLASSWDAAVAVKAAFAVLSTVSVATVGLTGAGGGMLDLSCEGGVEEVVVVLAIECVAAAAAGAAVAGEVVLSWLLAASCALMAAVDGCSPSESSSLMSAHR